MALLYLTKFEPAPLFFGKMALMANLPKLPASKRIFDLIVSCLALIILSPLMLITALAVWIGLGWPVIFGQKRPGYRAKIFTIYKFRTMRDLRDRDGKLLPDAARMTKLGRLIRSTSLDELPELFNVLKGEMSIVGPRPLLIAYLDRYSPEQSRRHDVLPGITGWAQVNGRNALSWEEKFALDVWYVDHWSFWLDIKIIFMSVGKVLKREAISAPGEATAPEFMGTKQK
jgi:lipopolysaccharide/colanic/teichoic acid biosynthesis glycosyltransferase